MDVYRTEEEQIAAIKGWWQKNGVAVLVAAILAVGTYAGWNWYRHHQLEQSLAASRLYESMMKSMQEAAAGTGDADAAQRLARAGEELMTKHEGTVYAQAAALLLASRAVETDDLAGAEKYLRAALAQDMDEATTVVTTDRLARVLSAAGRHDDALALLAGNVPEKLVGGREDVRGDVLFAQGKRAEARAAWQKAVDNTDPQAPFRQLIEMKVDYVAAD